MGNLPNQDDLIHAFTRLLEIEKKEPLSDEEKQYNDGLCHGLSIMYSYKSGNGNLEAWKSILNKIIEWDLRWWQCWKLKWWTNLPNLILRGIRDFLVLLHLHLRFTSIFTLGSNQFKNDVNFSTFGKVVHDVLSSQCTDKQSNFLKTQKELQKVKKEKGVNTSQFNIDKHKIKHHATASGYLTKDILNILLQKETFTKNIICTISFIGYYYKFIPVEHACSLHYKENKWYFYDPNTGEHEYTEKHHLISAIHKKLGKNLCIETASFHDEKGRNEINSFHKIYIKYLRKHYIEMMQSNGLGVIGVSSPHALPIIIEEIIRNSSSQEKFFNMLPKQNQDPKKCTALHIIARDAPKCLPELINLAKNNKLFSKAFSKSLGKQNSDGQTALFMISSLKDNVSFSKIIDLAKNNEDVKNSFTKALSVSHPNGTTILHVMIKRQSEETWNKLIKYASEDKDIRKAFIQTLLKKNLNGKTAIGEMLNNKIRKNVYYTLIENLIKNHPRKDNKYTQAFRKYPYPSLKTKDISKSEQQEKENARTESLSIKTITNQNNSDSHTREWSPRLHTNDTQAFKQGQGAGDKDPNIPPSPTTQ